MGWDAPWHWVILAIVVIALFGYKKLPDASRAVGRSLRIFKTELKGLTEDDKARDAAATQVIEAKPVVPEAATEQPAPPQPQPAEPAASTASSEKPATSAD